MNHDDARTLIKYIEETGKPVLPHEFKNIKDIRQRFASGYPIHKDEGNMLQETYCRVVGGGNRQTQPFKQYRRPTSRGV